MKSPHRLFLSFCLSMALVSIASAQFTIEVYADSTIAGHAGFLISLTEEDDPPETLFVFEEDGYLRSFAIREADSSEWDIFPPDQYICPTSMPEIGDSWDYGLSGYEGATTSHVEGFEDLVLPAGNFNAVECVIRPDMDPGFIIEKMYFADGVGLVLEYWPQDGGEDALNSYNIVGGSGLFPMAIGNTWTFGFNEVGVDDLPAQAGILHPCVPNPFNPATEISFEMMATGHARLEVYDVAGRRITTLADGLHDTGLHQVTWDGRDATGQRVVSGVYLYRLEAAGTVQSRRMMLVK